MKRIAFVASTLLFLQATTNSALAVTVNVSSNWEYWRYNYEPLSFEAGTYEITPIGPADGGTYMAWNAWGVGVVSACDLAGFCDRGYLNSYSFGYVGTNNFVYEIATIGGSVLDSTAQAYITPQLALANAKPYIFTLTEPTSLYFYLQDGETWYFDNVGGMSLSILQIPEPESYAMMIAGLGLLGFMAGRKKSA